MEGFVLFLEEFDGERAGGGADEEVLDLIVEDPTAVAGERAFEGGVLLHGPKRHAASEEVAEREGEEGFRDGGVYACHFEI